MIEAIGYIAGVLAMLSFLPQVVRTLKTRRGDDVSLGMLFMTLTTNILYVIYGFLLKLYPMTVMISIMTCIVIYQIILTLVSIHKWPFSAISASISRRLTSLRDRLCDVPRYASAQSLDFLDLAKNCSFLNWKLTPVPTSFLGVRGWALPKISADKSEEWPTTICSGPFNFAD